MPQRLCLALNHICAPRLPFARFAALARALDITDVEIRNDLPGVPLLDDTPAAAVRAEAGAASVSIASINALQRFNVWNDERAAEASALIGYASACGAASIVLCPLNSTQDSSTDAERAAGLRHALDQLAPMLSRAGLRGLVEPLGFPESSLRYKRDAVAAIRDVAAGEVFALVHDTFHHAIAGGGEIFPDYTGLVHISGVEDASVKLEEARDAHRVLVGGADRLDNAGQIRDLVGQGYGGLFSFEPCAASAHESADIEGALRNSIAYLRALALD